LIYSGESKAWGLTNAGRANEQKIPARETSDTQAPLHSFPIMSIARPLTSESLSDRIAEQLRLKIVQGALSPGMRLSEQTLADELAVSRNTLREAFRILTKDGLVKHTPNRGVFVSVPSIAAIIDIYRVRRLIECQALRNAYPLHPAKRHMRAAVEASMRGRAQADWAVVGTANMDFHMAIVELADSERLNQMFAPVLAELRLAFGFMKDAEFLHAPYVDMNRQILEIAEAGNYAKAADTLQEYLVHSERIVLAVYARSLSNEGLREN
jgi:DNA-binding GntR family transcriptional regulator